MKLHTQERDVEIVGQLIEKRSAQIELNPVIFEILSGKIYSNKILAVIRELSCNAVDAHHMAGHTKEFDVQLPTNIEPVFRIRDYGVGLSHENIFNLYMTFGASAKRNSDALIGGLGIGSKAPLAYTNGFTVCSYFNSEQRSYSVFIDEDGKPATSHIHTQPTEEPNGLEISVPVKQEDIFNFSNEALNVYKFFDPVKPNFVGKKINIKYPEYQIPFDTKLNWGWRENEGYSYQNQNVIAVMGNIGYPVSYHDVSSHNGWEGYLEPMVRSPLNIYFDIGTLDIAASREALSYTPKTQSTIIKRLKEIHEKYRKDFQEKLDNQENLWQACSFYSNNQSLVRNWFRYDSFSYKNKEISETIKIHPVKTGLNLDLHWVHATELSKYDFNRNKIKISFEYLTLVKPNSIEKIVLYDTSVQSQARLRTLWDTMEDEDKSILLVQPVNPSIKGQGKAFNQFIKAIEGHPKLIKLSSIEPDAKYINQGRKIARKTVELKVCEGLDTGSLVVKEDSSFDLNKLTDSVVVVRSRNNNLFFDKTNKIINEGQIAAVLNQLSYKEKYFLIVPLSRFSKKIKEHPKVILLEDFVEKNNGKELLENFVSLCSKKIELYESFDSSRIHNSFFFYNPLQSRYYSRMFDNFPSICSDFKDFEDNLKKAGKKENYITEKEHKDYQKILSFISSVFNISTWDKNALIKDKHKNISLKDLNIDLEKGEKVFTKYPLLRYIQFENDKVSVVKKEIESYIKTIDMTFQKC